MTNITKAQRNTLIAGAKAPDTCITEFMAQNSMIREKILNALLGKGLVERHAGKYRVTEAGHATISGQPKAEAAIKQAESFSADLAEGKKDAPLKGPKPPREESKQAKINSLLEREEGATLAELQKVTGWQPHSVRGHLSNMRRKKGIDIATFTTGEGKRGYRIPQEEEVV